MQYGASFSDGGDVPELPELQDVGQKDWLLPAGIHQAAVDDVAARLVNTKPTYQRRVDLWAAYQAFRTMVAGFVTIEHEYLDGSFVTSRPAPKDTDASFWVSADELNGLSSARQAAFRQLWSERIPRYSCDAYLVTMCDPGHPAYAHYQLWKQKTEQSWPAYKNRAKVIVPGIVKGYVEVVS